MYISDACKAASTTKKAIEYYCEKGIDKAGGDRKRL